MLRWTWTRFDFRTQKLSDVATAMIGRNREHGVDHVAVDVGSFLATGTGICRDLVGPERDHEVAKYITKNVASVVLKKLRPQKSVAFFFDGSDPMWKLRHIRKIANKSSASRYTRAAGSPLPFVVEDKLRAYLGERASLSEFVISGAATPGPAESKISAWALDMASRPDIKPSDSIVLLGSLDLAYSALALTPFHQISAAKLDRGDLKQVGMQELTEWLGIADLWRSGDNKATSRVRTDIVLVFLLTNSIVATNTFPIPNASFKDLLEAYHEVCVGPAEYITVDDAVPESADPLAADDKLLFAPTVGINAHRLGQVLSRASKKAPKPKLDPAGGPVAEYVETLLQTMTMLVDGGIRNHGFTGKTALETKMTVPMERLISHLLALPKDAVLKCTADETTAITAAEQILVGALTTESIDDSLPAFTNGHSLPTTVAEELLAIETPEGALARAQKLLTPIKAKSKHRAFSHSPTHFWMRKPGETGPPIGWAYASIDLGHLSRTKRTRLRHNVRARAEGMAAAKIKNALVCYDRETVKWEETDTKIEGSASTELTQLKVVTWNVQFDRFSGQTTPLGKPGIDWCTKTRYAALAKVLSTTNADIIAMQETEPTWWEYLSRQPWVQKDFAFSCPMRGEPITPWGQVMLINKRLPVTNMAAHNVPGYTGHTSVMPTCSIKLPGTGRTLNVCGIHLLAPYTQSNINVRVTQIETLMKRLSPKNVGEDVIVMGDFNDYPSNFFVMPPAMGAFKDAWVEAHGDSDGDAGYTINGRTSKYTSLIIEPEFFGRADRMLVKSKQLKVASSELIGTKSVREEMNIASCPDYLFPSDHYGIATTFDISSSSTA